MNKAKEFMKKNGKKVLIGAGIVLGVGLGYKYVSATKVSIKALTEMNSVQQALIEDLYEDKQIIMKAATEGVFEQAIARTVRKIDYRKERILAISENIKWTHDKAQSIMLDQYIAETSRLEERLESYQLAQAVFEIKDIAETEIA